ncbi:MAG TPA: nucleotidyltransferase domain-containing protein [Steroidobacteraceae bacterium]
MASQFMDLLFGSYRRQVLGLLLLRPDESLHVREIARLTGVPAGSLHRELASLESVGLLLREPFGNQVRYRANRTHPIYRELAEIFRKTSGLADLIRDALAPIADRISVTFVFGSIARDEAAADSDVDVCVLGDVTLVEVVALLASLHDRLGRSVNPVVMTPAAFQKQRKNGDRFVRRVMKEPKIFAIGDADDLG